MSRVFSVVNQKGGVGKTTTAVNLAACLASAGRTVLLIDSDPQANTTSGIGLDKTRESSIYDVLIDDKEISEAIIRSKIDNLAVLPAHIDLAGAELELMGRMSRESVLRRAIEPIRNSYDYILIDSPPALGLLTINSLVAADEAIVPIQCEYYALEGVAQLLKTIDLVRKHLNPGLEIGMVIMTMYDKRVRLNQQIVDEVRSVFKDKLARRLVPRNVRIAESPSHGLPVTLYDPRSQGAIAYRDIAQEVMKNGT